MKYSDCFFHCLAIHLNVSKIPNSFQLTVNKLKEIYKVKGPVFENFHGKVKLDTPCDADFPALRFPC